MKFTPFLTANLYPILNKEITYSRLLNSLEVHLMELMFYKEFNLVQNYFTIEVQLVELCIVC